METVMSRSVIKFNLAAIEEVATSLTALAKDANRFVAWLNDENFTGELAVDAGNKMYEGLGWISKFFSRLQKARKLIDLPMQGLRNDRD